MIPRSKARRFAMQMLYQMHGQPGAKESAEKMDFEPLFADFWQGVGEVVDEDAKTFAQGRVLGVWEHLGAIDEEIQKQARHWRLERMAPVDLSILRLGVYELKFCHLPVTIVINEAVELAKHFSNAESSAFVNGILDAIAKVP